MCIISDHFHHISIYWAAKRLWTRLPWPTHSSRFLLERGQFCLGGCGLARCGGGIRRAFWWVLEFWSWSWSSVWQFRNQDVMQSWYVRQMGHHVSIARTGGDTMGCPRCLAPLTVLIFLSRAMGDPSPLPGHSFSNPPDINLLAKMWHLTG